MKSIVVKRYPSTRASDGTQTRRLPSAAAISTTAMSTPWTSLRLSAVIVALGGPRRGISRPVEAMRWEHSHTEYGT